MKRRLAIGVLGLAVFAVVLLALAFALIDAPAVQAELRSRLSRAVDGEVTWESLDIGLFPAPRAELRGVRVAIPRKLNATAKQANVYLRLWPLLRGSVELSSVALVRPQINVSRESASDAPAPHPLALYESIMRPAVDLLREHAPDMTLRIDGAVIDLGTFQLQELKASARTSSAGVDLEAAARSNLWKQLSIDARIEYADLAARADIRLDGLVVDPDLPAASLRAKARIDTKSVIDCDFDAILGSVATAKGKALLPAGKPLHVAADVHSIDVAQAIALARRKVPLDVIESAEGRLSAKVRLVLEKHWQVGVHITRSDAAVKLAPLPWKLAAHAGRVTVTPRHVQVAGVKGALGESLFENVAARVELSEKPRLSGGSGNAILRLEQWFPWLRTKAPLDEIASLAGDVEVSLHRLALRFDRPQEADFDASATPHKVSAAVKMLPGAVGADGGSVRVAPKEVVLQDVAATLLDSHARVSGKFSLKNPALELAVAQGVAGEKLVRWAMERGEVAPRFEPKTPLRFSAQRVAWAPKRPLDLDARVEFPGGPALAAALAWQPERLELRRVALKDARTDALFGATLAGDLIEASFSGTLHGHSIPAMLRQPLPADSGTAQGELRLTIDRKQPQHTAGEGKLRIDGLDLSWLAGAKALIEHAEIVAERDAVRIPAARVGWEEQFFDLRGTARRTPAGPLVDARIESTGVDAFRLLPPPNPNAPRKKTSALWPLPVSGRIELRTAFVQYKEYRVEPFDGIVSLEPERARLEVKEARLCGLSIPMELEMQPEQGVAAAHIRMKDQPLERTVRCLTGGNIELTGNANLAAELHLRGRRPHLLRGLTGTLEADVRDGRVKKFALLGNILSARDIATLGAMQKDGFSYRSMTTKGHFRDGQFLVDEAFFDSDAVRLAASGNVDLQGPHSQLTVLMGLLTTVDRIAEAVPILGDIFGGSMTALPMSVTGDIRDPRIVPLGPRAVTDQLLGIFERTLKLPGKLLVHPDAKPPAAK